MTLKKRQQDGGGGRLSRLGRSSRTQVVPMSAPAAPTGSSQRYAVATRRGLSSPTFIERETFEALFGLIRNMLNIIGERVPEASPMMDASIQARFIPSLRAYKRTYRDYDRLNALFRQRFQIPTENPSQLYDLYSYYKHAEAFRRETEPNYNLLNFNLYPYGTFHRPNYTTVFYKKCMDFFMMLQPRQTTLFNDPDTREVYPVRASLPTRASLASLASLPTRASPAPLPGAVSAPVATEIPFEYAVYKNPNPGEKPDAPPCTACDEEADIEGEWIFTVSYPYKNNRTGATETKIHYYDYDTVIKPPLSTQQWWRHPILMGTHRIDLNEIRRLGRLKGAPEFALVGGGGSMSRPRVPSPEELTRIQTFKQILDDLIQNILNSSYIAPGIAAVFAEAEHRPFLATQAAFEAAYPAVRDIYEPRFRTAIGERLPADITLYRLYRLYMHAVYCLKTPPDYNLLGYSNRRNNTYDAEVLAVIAPIQRAARVYLDRVERERRDALERLRAAVHGAPIRFKYTVKKNPHPDKKPNAPVCFACDSEADIEGEWIFTVSYKLNETPYIHYYDYDEIIGRLPEQHRIRHPILMEHHYIDLDAIREKMAALRARQARKSGGRLRKPTS